MYVFFEKGGGDDDVNIGAWGGDECLDYSFFTACCMVFIKPFMDMVYDLAINTIQTNTHLKNTIGICQITKYMSELIIGYFGSYPSGQLPVDVFSCFCGT